MSTIELMQFVSSTFEEAGKINSFSTYVSYSGKNDIINLAKTYRKRFIASNKTEVPDPVFTLELFDEECNELRKIGFTKLYDLKTIIRILIGANHFFMSKQQLQKFII